MNQLTSWQQLWDRAQTTLGNDERSLANATSPASRILRVGQLDAELLDVELVNLLRDPLSKALGLINSTLKSRFEPELSLFIQLTLYRLSVWATGASYGAKLQDLKYIIPLTDDRGICACEYSTPRLPRKVLLIHGALTIILPYIHTRLRGHALSKAWPDAPSSDRRRMAWELMIKLETAHAAFALASFIAFLWDGQYRTTVDRLLSMKLVPSRRLVRRNVSYEYMNRQMVWHAFTEFLIFLLPLLPHRKLRRVAGTATGVVMHPLTTLSTLVPAPARAVFGLEPYVGRQQDAQLRKGGRFTHLPANECAICYENASAALNVEDPTHVLTLANPLLSQSTSGSHHAYRKNEPPMHPLTTPYRTSCGHIYCYTCIAEKMLRAADEGGSWECLRCAEPVLGAERFRIEATYWTSEGDDGSIEEWGSDYFDEMGSSSLSGVSGMSAGSRSWASGSDE
ncbi:Pex12 amino terminal region-domain-containing protein [Multifurca ochricompacta]|uniref:RING-type E3 ubiquitin transferase (cysteine targeting) n=1 Tax=Multifurca ochricompacta TaxID=376703 RepID=A0AAD4QR29_9AGAM|nr:Pex12 amino terminal region-domain-containing protein [Multifurca ochricompacta]